MKAGNQSRSPATGVAPAAQNRGRRPRLLRRRNLWDHRPLQARFLAHGRRFWLAATGFISTPPPEKEWLIFPYYHWVLGDEHHLFRRQLRRFRQYGEIISLADALTALGNPVGLGGRFFCLTFDDGFLNWKTNAVPVLVDEKAPAAFFIPTKYIGLDLDTDWDEVEPFYRRSYGKYGRFFEFLTWEDCREMLRAGFVIGSHTHSHVRLTGLTPGEAQFELGHSKQVIEEMLGAPCRHFACPWGKPGDAFDPAVHPGMASSLGYESFLTTCEGPNLPGTSPLYIRRNAVAPDFGPLLLRRAIFLVS